MKSFIFIAAILLPFALAAPASSESEQMVLTPSGLRPASSVHQVPEGGSINISGDEIQLLDASHNIVHVAPRNNANITVPQQSGWITYASWYNNGPPITYFDTTWSVPPEPVTYHGQTVFLFNSIEPANYDAILQPVLQYGPSAAGGGPYWSVANWYVSSSVTYYNPLVDVNVGDQLLGVIALESNSGSSYNYISAFVGDNNERTLNYLELNNSAELVWATETLEAYGITTGSDYPKGSTVFSEINLDTSTGNPSVSWVATNDVGDGLTTTIVTNGATNGEIRINYPT